MTSSGPLVPAQETHGPKAPGIYWRHVSTTISRGYLESLNKSPRLRARTVPKMGGPKRGAPKLEKNRKKKKNFFKKKCCFTEEIVLKIEHEKKVSFCRISPFSKMVIFGHFLEKKMQKTGKNGGISNGAGPPPFKKLSNYKNLLDPCLIYTFP